MRWVPRSIRLFLWLLVAALRATAAEPVASNGATPPGTAIAVEATPGPRVAFDQTSFNFGKIESGEIVKHTFFFTNLGNQVLEVREVRPSCGCTTTGDWDKRVEPGNLGRIPVQFSSMGYGGEVHKTMTVVCNDPANSNAVLQITGTVWKPIEIAPQFASFLFGPDVQTNDTRVLRIISNLPEPLTVSDPMSGNPVFQPELTTVKEGKEYELRVTVVPPLKSPNVSTPITLKTSYSKMAVMTVNAFAMVQPAVGMMPMQITLPAGPLTNAAPFAITLQNNSTNSLVLSDPKVNIEGVEAKLRELQPGRRFELTVTFPAGFQCQAGHPIEATVESNFPQLPTLKVPVFQTAAAPTVHPPAPALSTKVTPSAATPRPNSAEPPVDSAHPSNLTNPASAGHGPKIEFATMLFDFGRVESGKVVSHSFPFTNQGDEALEIRDVVSSCGCAAVENFSHRVEPGESGTLPVLFNTSGMGGSVVKTLRVQSNAIENSNLVIEISAVVYKPIDALPAVAAFNFGPDFQTNETRVIRVVSNLDDPVTISDPVCSNRQFRAELKTVSPGKEFELRVSVVPPITPGSTVAPITLATSSPKMPVVSVTAYVMAQPAFVVTPPRLRLSHAPLTDPERFVVRIQNQSTNAIVLSDPAVNANNVELAVRQLQPGKLFELAVRFPAGFQVPQGEQVELRVKSSHPQFPFVTVPVLQPVSSPADEKVATTRELSPTQLTPPPEPNALQ